MSALLAQALETAIETVTPSLKRSIRSIEPLTRTLGQHNAIDMYEIKDRLVVKMQMPGYEKVETKVRLDGNKTLIVSACKNSREDYKQGVRFYRSEINTEAFEKSIALPKPVKMSESGARLENGILEVRLQELADSQSEIPID